MGGDGERQGVQVEGHRWSVTVPLASEEQGVVRSVGVQTGGGMWWGCGASGCVSVVDLVPDCCF